MPKNSGRSRTPFGKEAVITSGRERTGCDIAVGIEGYAVSRFPILNTSELQRVIGVITLNQLTIFPVQHENRLEFGFFSLEVSNKATTPTIRTGLTG